MYKTRIGRTRGFAPTGFKSVLICAIAIRGLMFFFIRVNSCHSWAGHIFHEQLTINNGY